MAKKILSMALKRIIQSIIVIILVSMLVFFLIQLIPGDPVTNFLGSSATQEQIDYYTHLYGYDKPVIVQYVKWLAGFLQGNMGFSITYQTNVENVIFDRLATTLSIIVPALIIAVIFGVGLGIVAALRRGKPVDTVICFIANVGMSMPAFWIGIILMLIFSIEFKWFPANGYEPLSAGILNWAKHLVLPVVVCSFSALSTITRQTRSAMLEVIRQEYVTTARSKGVKSIRVIFTHQLRNALIPVVTVLGTQFGFLIGGTVLVESVFVMPGLGSLMIGAINSRDHMMVCGCVVIIAAFVALIQLLVDILYLFIDPRIRG